MKEIRKNIDLPTNAVVVLGLLAEKERMTVKNYMELVLIKYAKRKSLLIKKEFKKSIK